LLKAEFRIYEILRRRRIRFHALDYGSVSASCSFRPWLSKNQLKNVFFSLCFFCLLRYLGTAGTLTSVLKYSKPLSSTKQLRLRFFLIVVLIDGKIQIRIRTTNYRSGSGRPKKAKTYRSYGSGSGTMVEGKKGAVDQLWYKPHIQNRFGTSYKGATAYLFSLPDDILKVPAGDVRRAFLRVRRLTGQVLEQDIVRTFL
jgi:hypothetical protein